MVTTADHEAAESMLRGRWSERGRLVRDDRIAGLIGIEIAGDRDRADLSLAANRAAELSPLILIELCRRLPRALQMNCIGDCQ